MLTLEDIQARLKDRKLKKVAESVGLAYATVWRVATNRAPDVSYLVVKKLSDYFTSQEAG